MRGRPSVEKRRKEMARAERKRDKAARRAERREQVAEPTDGSADGVDPDIAGIVPGPQPLPYDVEDDNAGPQDGRSSGEE